MVVKTEVELDLSRHSLNNVTVGNFMLNNFDVISC